MKPAILDAIRFERLQGIACTPHSARAAPRNDFNGNKMCASYDLTRNLEIARLVSEPAAGGTRTTTYTYDAGNMTGKTIVGPRNDGTSATVTRSMTWVYGK